jgi:hypothetical protein
MHETQQDYTENTVTARIEETVVAKKEASRFCQMGTQRTTVVRSRRSDPIVSNAEVRHQVR